MFCLPSFILFRIAFPLQRGLVLSLLPGLLASILKSGPDLPSVETHPGAVNQPQLLTKNPDFSVLGPST